MTPIHQVAKYSSKRGSESKSDYYSKPTSSYCNSQRESYSIQIKVNKNSNIKKGQQHLELFSSRPSPDELFLFAEELCTKPISLTTALSLMHSYSISGIQPDLQHFEKKISIPSTCANTITEEIIMRPHSSPAHHDTNLISKSYPHSLPPRQQFWQSSLKSLHDINPNGGSCTNHLSCWESLPHNQRKPPRFSIDDFKN